MGLGKLTVVTDAGPLIHLAEIDGLSLLTIFETLHLPKAVWLETVVKQRVSADDLSRLGNLQTHILLQAAVTQFCQRHSLTNLHTGETECFYLCSWLKVSTLLTDDLAARNAAKLLNLTPVGALGIVVKAYQRGHISLAEAEHYLIDLYGVSSLYLTKAIVELAIKQLPAAVNRTSIH